jgi:hypothetical protein
MNSENPVEANALFEQILQVVEQAKSHVKQAVNSQMVQAYWQVGRLIVEREQQGQARAEYGKAQLKTLSQQLTQHFGKGFDVTNLRNMRRFYQAFPMRDALRLELSWTHYRTLLRIENKEARSWYMKEAEQQTWSARALERQQRTRFDDEDFYIDLVFYNFKLKCFLLICYQYYLNIWIMDTCRMHGMSRWHGCQRSTTYVRLYDEQYKGSDDNPTIGLVLCSEKSEAVVKYSVLNDQKQLFASKYMIHLPSEKELKQELERERANIQQQLADKKLQGADDAE